MSRFYFNDCLPPCGEQSIFIHCLSQTLQAFHHIAENLNIEKAVVTEKLPSAMFLGNDYSLDDTISKIKDKNLKRLAYAYFIKYPIATYFSLEEQESDPLLEANYQITINYNSYNALNLAMVCQKGGFSFTVALHDDLKQNTLSLKSNTSASIVLSLNNLYGDTENIKVIEDILRNEIERLRLSHLSNLDQLQDILGTYLISSKAEKAFLKLTDEEQQSIIVLFGRAKSRNAITPFAPDQIIIKDVTPSDKKCKVKVYELRVFAPTAMRVYFNETNHKVFVGSIEFKSNPNQSEDIQNACLTLNKMILTS